MIKLRNNILLKLKESSLQLNLTIYHHNLISFHYSSSNNIVILYTLLPAVNILDVWHSKQWVTIFRVLLKELVLLCDVTVRSSLHCTYC